jgi:S1-C subfamily serine protease
MNRILKGALPVALALVTTAALAGGAECHKADVAKAEHKKCNMSAEACKKEMAEAKTRGWIGLELDESEAGMVVTAVVPDSPAQAAGFQKGDVLLALNGVTLNEANQEKVQAIRKNLHPGDSVTYTVKRGDGEARVSPKLAPWPEKVYQAMVEEHMKQHTDIAAK